MENLTNLCCSTCGGALVVEGNSYKCNCCGNCYPKSTELTSEMVVTLNRADSLRRKFLFDDALEEYELVLGEQNEQIEANWGAFLCEYGIEYVLDYDETYKPTCHRISERPVTKSKYYAYLTEEYREKASEVENIRIKVLKQVNQVPSYDVFLCYKQNKIDSDVITEEAKWARDVYEELTYKKGLKVFYAEKSLAELNVDWESHIYAALRSSKLMIVFATSLVNLNSPWVKNEWKRFHSFAQEDSNKIIRVVYEKLDPYILPKELQDKQAIDQDRGNWMSLVVDAATNVKESGFFTKKYSNPLIARAMMCLEDGDFVKANELADTILNDDAKCAKAYIIKLMAEYQYKYESQIYQIPHLGDILNFVNALSCADEGYKKYLLSLSKESDKYLTYQNGLDCLGKNEFARARDCFSSIRDYKNSTTLLAQCNDALRGRAVNGLGVTRNFVNNSADRFDQSGSNARRQADCFNTRSNNITNNAISRLARLSSTYSTQIILGILLLLFCPFFGLILGIILIVMADGTKQKITSRVASSLHISPNQVWNRYKLKGKNARLFVDEISEKLYDMYGTNIDLNKMFV